MGLEAVIAALDEEVVDLGMVEVHLAVAYLRIEIAVKVEGGLAVERFDIGRDDVALLDPMSLLDGAEDQFAIFVLAILEPKRSIVVELVARNNLGIVRLTDAIPKPDRTGICRRGGEKQEET
jgi:hypothetical protein